MNERTMAEEIEEEVMLRSYPDRPCAFATTGEPYALIGIDGRRAPGEYCGFTTSLALAVAALKQAIHAYIRDVTKGETAGWRILWRVAPTIESHEIEIKVGDDDTLVLDGIEKTPRALHRKQQVYTGRARLLVTNLPPRFDLNGDPLDSDARAACGLPPLTREQADATIGAFLRQIKEDADWRAERERGVAEAQRLLRAGPSEALHDAARFQGFPGYKITETYGFDARRADSTPHITEARPVGLNGTERLLKHAADKAALVSGEDPLGDPSPKADPAPDGLTMAALRRQHGGPKCS